MIHVIHDVSSSLTLTLTSMTQVHGKWCWRLFQT